MLLCNVGVLKTVQCTTVRQQWLVAGWLGPSVTVRVKVRARAREWCFSLLFLFSPLLFFLSQTSWCMGPVSEGTPREDPGTSVGNTGHPSGSQSGERVRRFGGGWARLMGRVISCRSC